MSDSPVTSVATTTSFTPVTPPSRGAVRLRAAALVAVPLLALAVGCGGSGSGSGSGDSGGKDDQVASVPDASGEDQGTGDGKGSKDGKEGEGSGDRTGKSAFYDAQMEYVRCMRTKAGLKDFPDPKLSGYLDWPRIDELVDPNGGGEEYKGGKDGVCVRELRDAMNLEPKRDAQQDYESMLAHATCMRDKGVSAFRNPTMSGGNVLPGGEPDPASPKIDHDSPAYKKAREACAGKLLEGLDGMQ
ncbi:hypothetical protein [Streptomyces sp. CC224B]|uniref:hypothetical protein n=1 Tax=Streptomyces sp. CC224B TaxID=3044571 RepID=UPI0024A8D675|nr:hypothetical protein [Streptomyces sp. CC224B]